VSGGEKKRVAIGQELLFNPSVILLDEPTSGLDSTTALSLINTLNTLAKEGNRTVLTTIHQPSSRIYQKLDKLLLLGLGNVLYFGDASQAHEYFREIGYPMPYGMNCADFLLDTASGGSDDPELKTLLKAIETKPSTSARAFCADDEKNIELAISEANEDECKPSYWLQCVTIAKRSIKDGRFDRFSGHQMFTLLFLAFLCGILWFQKASPKNLQNLDNAMDVGGILFFMAAFLSFSTLFSCIFTFPSEKIMLTKERASKMYPISAFFWGRSAADLPLDTTIPLTVATVLYFTTGLTLSAAAYFETMVLVLLVIFVAGSLGLFLGALFLDSKKAQSAATVIMLTFMLSMGFFIRNMPAWIGWVKYLAFTTYTLQALTMIHIGDTFKDQCSDVAPGDATLAQECLIANGQPGAFLQSKGACFGMLCLMFVVYRVLVYVALRWGVTKNK